MMYQTKILFFIVLLGSLFISYPQAVFEPVYNPIYPFLERMNLKGFITLNDETSPFSRKMISEKLLEISNQKSKLNLVENEELEWFMKEFFPEILREQRVTDTLTTFNIVKNDAFDGIKSILYPSKYSLTDRIRLYGYNDKKFSLNLSPRAGYEIKYFGDKKGHSRWIGLRVFGSYGNNFAAFFDYVDRGDYFITDRRKDFASETSFFINNAGTSRIEYSDMRGGVTVDWQWATLSLQKDYINWGHGKNGQLILSSNATSFPHIYLTFQPVEWFRCFYIHGFLNSLVIDSSASYYNHWGNEKPFLREEYVGKYFVANQLTFTPYRDVDISVGNIFVYSGRLRPEMFIPFIYYKVMDHNTGRGGVDDGNGFIFFDFSIKHPHTFKFYSTILFDGLNIREILSDNNWYTSPFGFTVGIKKVDFIFDNIDFSIEYTRNNLWLYEHKDETTTYKHIDYNLGHWIGQNADNIKIMIDYLPISRMRLSAYLENFRKGGLEDISYVYERNKPQLGFLYSPVRKDFRIGFKTQYEIIHEFIWNFEYRYTSVTDEDIKRTLDFQLGSKHNFVFSLSYGY